MFKRQFIRAVEERKISVTQDFFH